MMEPKRYQIAGRTFCKVIDEKPDARAPFCHVVEEGQFWKGDKSWEHRAVCGRSISGNALGSYAAPQEKLTCKECRKFCQELPWRTASARSD